MLLADRFYAGEHDLVVNTGSMYGGAPRADRQGDALPYQQGAAVNHFNYFKNAASAEAHRTALARPDFGALAAEGRRLRAAATAGKADRPRAEPWPSRTAPDGVRAAGDHGQRARGERRPRVDRLRRPLRGRARAASASTRPASPPLRPYASYYGELIEYLADTHKVIAFPYDWRLEPEKEADRLAQDLSRAVAEAKAANQPVRIVAHSMGGLIVRTMIARHPEVWREMASQPAHAS